MTTVALLVLFLATSAIVAVIVARTAPPANVGAPIVRRLLEFTGLWIACLAANLALGVLVILVLRAVGRLFAPVYVLNDVSVVVVSALQAFALHTRATGRP